MGVATAPGPTPTTRMLCGASSTPAVRVSIRMPPLERQYASVAGHGPIFVHRSDVDDSPAAALLDHLFGRKLGSEEGALQIDLKHLLVLLFGRFEHGCASLDAGVVHHDVQPAKRFHGCGDQPFQVRHLAHVRLYANGLIAEQRDLFFELLGRFRMGDVVDHDVRALPGQFEHNGLADTAVTTGDNGDFVLQKHE